MIRSKAMALEVSIHYDEIGLKGRNRPFFEGQLRRNVRTALQPICRIRVRPFFGRIILDTAEDAPWDAIREALARVFGIAHFGRIRRCSPDLAEVARVATAVLPGEPDTSPETTFAVKATRVDRSYPIRSPEICRTLGTAIQRERPWAVDLTNPDITVHVTILQKVALIRHEKIRGPGGLPVGVSAKAACLLSGGIDSPVAAHRVMRRGCPPVFIHFHSYPFTRKSSQETALRLAEHLLTGLPRRPLWLVPLGEIQQEIISGAPPDLRVLLYRRFMLRLAERIARQEGALALVTGESIGQVASQTVENMAAIEHGITLPILRPLVGFDKQEIVAAARRIGTFDIRAPGQDDCCSYLLPPNPATKATREDLDAAEAQLPHHDLLEDALARAERTIAGADPRH